MRKNLDFQFMRANVEKLIRLQNGILREKLIFLHCSFD
jgi:hypothetical protein